MANKANLEKYLNLSKSDIDELINICVDGLKNNLLDFRGVLFVVEKTLLYHIFCKINNQINAPFFGISEEQYIKYTSLPKQKQNPIFNQQIDKSTEIYNIYGGTKMAEKIAKKTISVYTEENPNKPLVALRSILPPNYIRPNTKLSKNITKWDLNKETEKAIEVSKKGAKNEILTLVKIKYDDSKVTLSDNVAFTEYDRIIQDGVITLYAAGNEIITSKMVYHAINGMTNGEKVSPQAIGAVTKSLEKAGRIRVYIDYTAEAQAYKKDTTNTIYDGALLAYEGIEVTAGGETIKAFKLLTSPILYRYAQVSGQIYTIPTKVLQTSKIIDSTAQNMVIRDFLIKQIEEMKSPSFTTRNDVIKLETLYTRLDLNTQSAGYGKEKQRVRNAVEKYLDYWKTDGEYIKDYSKRTKGKSTTGYEIELLNKDVVIDVKSKKVKKITTKK